jgi:hypothetical protein
VDLGDYGPFANIVAIASALVATFSLLLLKMLGGVKQWTWLAGGSPSFLVTAGARILAIALMAAAYVAIDKSNYRWFLGAAVLSGAFGFGLVAWFDRLSKQHVLRVPLVGSDGTQLVDKRSNPRFRTVVIGLEDDLEPEAKRDLRNARKEHGGLSLGQFMSGYGTSVNDPGALWSSTLLAKVGNKLTLTLMFVVLLAVITVFLAALSIDASQSA